MLFCKNNLHLHIGLYINLYVYTINESLRENDKYFNKAYHLLNAQYSFIFYGRNYTQSIRKCLLANEMKSSSALAAEQLDWFQSPVTKLFSHNPVW